MIFAFGTPQRGHTIPELDRFAIACSPYSLLDCKIREKDTSGQSYRGPEGLIVICTAFRYFTGTPLSVAGRKRQFLVAFSASAS